MNQEQHHHDPYEGMTDEELDRHFAGLFEQKERTVSVTLRMPEDLLRRTKRLAEAKRVPYQRLIKQILDAAVTRIEKSA